MKVLEKIKILVHKPTERPSSSTNQILTKTDRWKLLVYGIVDPKRRIREKSTLSKKKKGYIAETKTNKGKKVQKKGNFFNEIYSFSFGKRK